ncbi:hypothetical protein PRIPAC_76649, partial [Pristionchus pacificus]|uniref:BTD domain-containing protein n=1 Tax=Pristionchus pacificus TaxID=54126 RepID=A0A2A6C032_PRIPA
MSKVSKKKQDVKSADAKVLCIRGGTETTPRWRSKRPRSRLAQASCTTVVPASPPSQNHIQLDPSTHDEPVAQLHKCAFQVIDAEDELTYLWMSHDTIMLTHATRLPNSPLLLEVSDGAVWTVISVNTEEYRFFEAAGPARYPITPAPRVTDVETVGPTDNESITITRRPHTMDTHVLIGGVYMSVSTLGILIFVRASGKRFKLQSIERAKRRKQELRSRDVVDIACGHPFVVGDVYRVKLLTKVCTHLFIMARVDQNCRIPVVLTLISSTSNAIVYLLNEVSNRFGKNSKR